MKHSLDFFTRKKLSSIGALLAFIFATPFLIQAQICDPMSSICVSNNNHDMRAQCNASCTANNVTLQEFRAVPQSGGGPCVQCTAGELVTWDLEGVFNVTNNGNTCCFSISGDLWINNVLCCTFSRSSSTCVSAVGIYTIDFGDISFTCGDQLELKNILLAWGTNANSCNALPNFCPPGGQCGTNPDILIKTPVAAACSSTPASCAGGEGVAMVDARGGTPPYSYSWRDASNQMVGNTASISVNPGTYQVTVTDGDNCTATCSVEVTVAADMVNPTITCPAHIIVNNSPGACGAIVNFNATANDNCPGVAISYSHQPGSFFPVGTTSVTATATDAANNSAQCTFNITVNDNEVSPACRNITVQLNSAGVVTVLPADLNNGSTDNCGIQSMSINPATFTCANLGNNTVTLTVIDINGNSDICTATVTVEDNIPPTALCVPGLTIDLDPSGNASITATQINNGSTDNCGTPTLSIIPSSFDCSHVGPNTVTLTVTDIAGNQSSCTTTVTVRDQVPPVANCRNLIVQLNPSGMASITAADINNNSSDNCGIASLEISRTTFTCVDIGPNIVTLTVTDIHGNSSTCFSTVTIQDLVPPTAITRNITIPLNSAGVASITVADINNGSSDNCLITNMVVSPSTFDCSNLGNNAVSLIITDASGNTANAVATVSVVDLIHPTITCSPNLIVNNDPGVCGAVVNFNVPVSDNCQATVVCTPPSGSLFPINETTTVTCTATDQSGNQTSCTFTVTVLDNFAPGLICPADVTISCEESTDPTNTGNATTSDLCGGSPATITYSDAIAVGSCPNSFIITRTWVATDGNNNTSRCDQVINIIDGTAPSISCPAQINVSCEADVPAPNPSLIVTSDNCSGPITVTHVSDEQTGISPILITRTYRAVDECQNESLCTQIIIVQNLTAPVLTCPPTLILECIEDVPAADVDEVIAQANCGGAVTVSHVGDVISGSCPTTITRTYQGVDQDGNMASCTQTIIVNDVTSPIISNCPGNVDFGCFTSGLPGLINLPPALTDPTALGASDNCTPTNQLVVSHQDFGPIVDGCLYTFERIYTLTDGCGNATECTAQQFTFIYDVTPPIFSNLPADQVYACGSPVPPVPAAPIAIDECPGLVSIAFSEVKTDGSCSGEAYLRTWTATDACGNVTSYTQIASMQDLSPPEIIRPNDTTIYCGQEIPPSEYSIIESCAASRYIEEYKEVIVAGSCACEYTIMRIWHVYNSCLAAVRDTQFIQVIDETGPSITMINPMLQGIENGGTMIMYNCSEPGVLMSDILVDDCCGVANVQLYDSLLAYKSCEAFDYFALWVCGYIATDPCGNQTEFRFYVQQVDTTTPTFIVQDSFVHRWDLNCDDSIPEAPSISITDDCDLLPNLTYRADTVGFYPDSFAIIRTWEASDACLNTEVLTQTIAICSFEPDSFVAEIGNLAWLDENENGMQDIGEKGINGIAIELYADHDLDGLPDPALLYSTNTKTRNGIDGQYYFENLSPGHYFVKVSTSEAWSLIPNHQGQDPKMDSDIDPATGFSPRLEVKHGQKNLDVDIGIRMINEEVIEEEGDGQEEEGEEEVGEEEVDETVDETVSSQITSFAAEKNNCSVLLKWSISLNENDGQSFEIQRSRDGSNYGRIGVVQSSGPQTEFKFEDKNPLEKGFYKLLMTDGTGIVSNSNAVYIETNCKSVMNFVLHPNPARGQINITYQHDTFNKLTAQIIDVYGRTVKEWVVTKRYRGQVERIELDLSDGLYWLRLNDGQTQVTKPLLIMENTR